MTSASAILFALLLAVGQAANFSGKWSVPQPGRNGARINSVLTINQAGSTVSGTLSSGRPDGGAGSSVSTEIFGGKVEGDTITFYIWRGTDRPAKQFYKGVMIGDEINFTVTGGPAPAIVSPNASRSESAFQVTAKRAAN
jgi:hypothetical protein